MRFLVLVMFLTSCAPLLIGGGALVGTAVTKEKGLVGSMGDTRIANEVRLKLHRRSGYLYSNVGVASQNGQLLLTGCVSTPNWREEAERTAWSVSGVKQVENHIEVDKPESLADLAKDSIITTEVKTRLFFAKNVSSLNYSVKTVKGVVYIMGVAKKSLEIEKIIEEIKKISGVKKVYSFIKLKEEL